MAKLINELLLLTCMGGFHRERTWSAPQLRLSGSRSRFWPPVHFGGPIPEAGRATDLLCERALKSLRAIVKRSPLLLA
jgi:hypothetical protein